jgi:transcriptional regulator with XRE-family HTH domain
MITVSNTFGKDPVEFNDETSADRVGARIRNIRMAKGLSLAELGEKVGLNADRMQKYENGARKPKPDMLKKIAEALGVSTLALADPVTTSYIGAMYAMFELERNFNMKIEPTDEDHVPGMCLTVDFKDSLYEYMKDWYEVYAQMKSDLEVANSEEEKTEIIKSYHNWEWTFPQGIVDKTEKNLEKARLKRKIAELQERYDQLDQNDSDGE